MRSLLYISLLFTLFSCSQEKTLENGRNIPVEGGSLFTYSLGQGEPILIIHGGPGLNHSYFLPHFNELAKDHQLIFYDQRLSGKSSSDVDSNLISIRGFVEDIESIRKAYNLEQIHVLGHSWGALLAQFYAIIHPEKVKSLLLIGSMPIAQEYRSKEESLVQSKVTKEDMLERIRFSQSQSLQESNPDTLAAFFHLLFKHQFTNPVFRDSLELNFSKNFIKNSAGLSFLEQSLGNYDLRPVLDRITAPTLILYGSDDPLLQCGAQEMESFIENSTLSIVSNCGHFPFIEKKKVFFFEIRNFLHPERATE